MEIMNNNDISGDTPTDVDGFCLACNCLNSPDSSSSLPASINLPVKFCRCVY